MDFLGITTALITPFKKGHLDKDSFLNLLSRQVDDGIRSFVINGTTGESPNLLEDEVFQLCSWFRSFEKQKQISLKLILGTGTFSTKSSLQKTSQAEKLKADAVLVVVPYYNKPSQEGLLEHFKQVSASTTLPVLLYNVPSRTSLSLSVETIKELAKINNIIGIKEASGDMNFLKQIKEACDEDFLILSGDDFTAVESFFLGAKGVISVCSHVLAKEMNQFFQKALKKDKSVIEEFKTHNFFLEELYRYSNPIGIKVLLKELGWIESSELRLPLKEPFKQNLMQAFLKK